MKMYYFPLLTLCYAYTASMQILKNCFMKYSEKKVTANNLIQYYCVLKRARVQRDG